MSKKVCCEIEMTDFSYNLSLIGRKQSHFYCTRCGSHYFKGKNYTAEEWFFYINGVAYDREAHILSNRHIITKEVLDETV